MTDEEIASGGYQHLLTPQLRLAHQALLAWASEVEPDGWPTPASVTRFAAFYGVPSAPLGALFGLLSRKVGRSVAWVDAAREHQYSGRLRDDDYGPEVQACFGIYRAATAVLEREDAAAVH